MRISGRNLNKKEDDDNLYHPPPLYERPDFPQFNDRPIIVKSKTPVLLIIIIVAVVLIPVGFVGVGIISAIAIPNLLASKRAADQGRAISDLRTFSSAQATFQATTGNGKYGSFDDLKTATLISPSNEVWTRPPEAYAYTLSRSASGDRYCILATSPKAKRVLAVDERGAIYVSETGAATCTNGALSGGDLKPVQ
ncbi:MAG TPA: hypothetical protein VIL74_00475 [Pyrinomonadaceae bacterium]|jgi:type II secretory pathway pseudopilin PulG